MPALIFKTYFKSNQSGHEALDHRHIKPYYIHNFS